MPPRRVLKAFLAALLLAPAAAALAAEPCGSAGVSRPQVLERRAPAYPDGARAVGTEGFVDVELTVLRDGRAGWVRVRRAEPAGLFEAAALDAVRDWRFTPPEQGGAVVECTLSTRVRFALSDEIMPGQRDTDGPGRAFPVFPEAARAAGIEGYVRIEYGVAHDGGVIALEILESVPRGAFDDAVRTALAQWRYAPGSAPAGHASREFRFRLPAYARPDAVPQHTPASYPAALCATRVRGRVTLDVEIESDGRVTNAVVVAAEPPGVFEGEALRLAPQLRRGPARRAGAAIAAPGRVTLEFAPERHCDTADDPARGSRGRRGPRVGANDR